MIVNFQLFRTSFVGKADTNNHDLEPPIESESEHEALNDAVLRDAKLSDVSESLPVQPKGRPAGATNKKGVMTRAEKTKGEDKIHEVRSFWIRAC